MKGISVRLGADGVWYTRPYLGKNKVTGGKVRPYRRFPEAACEEEALEMARDWAATRCGAASLGISARLTDMVRRYIDVNEGEWAANTAEAYATCLRAWIAPNVGDITVDEFTPAEAYGLYEVLRLRGRRDGAPLSASSRALVHQLLNGAYKWAVECDIAARNPMEGVRRPRFGGGEAAALRRGEFAKLQGALAGALDGGGDFDGRMVAMAAYLALNTGMRCGEACAVALGDVHPAFLHVGATVVEQKGKGPFRQPHTKGRKPRNVSIAGDVAERIALHMEWRAPQLPAAAAGDWDLSLVCDRSGGLLRPSTVSRSFTAMLRSLGLPAGTTFHTLRHTHATYLIAEGYDLRTVQERLGHAKPSTTLDLYAHVLPGRDRAAADAFSAIAAGIGGAP